MNTKRIIIFSLVYYPRFIGGAEVALKEITDRLPGDTYEFDMVTLRMGDSSFEKIGAVNVHRIGRHKYLFPFLGAWKASRLHNEKKYDAIWSIQASYNGFAALFFKMSHTKAPFILTLQEGDPIEHYKRRVGVLFFLYKRIFLSANIIQTISKYLANFAKEMGYKGEIAVVPNGVDVAHFSIVPNFSFPEKRPGDIFLITASRLVPKNAVIDIVRALEFLSVNVKLLICGTGYEEKNLRLTANKLHLQDRVVFKGFVSHDELPKYLKAADIFVRPSLSEGFGNSFVEAMAAKIPVIATNVGGISDFLQNKKTGLFCGINDPKDLARKVEIYLRDKNLRYEIIENAFSMAKEKYDWNIIAKDMKEKVFDKIFS